MKNRHWLRQVRILVSVLAVVTCWELVGRHLITNALILVPPSAVFLELIQMIDSGEFQRHLAVSFQEFGIGFGVAILIGVGVGLLLAASDRIRDYVDPWLSALFATPIVAVAPIFVMWFGVGLLSKIPVIFLVAFFPIVINTTAGVLSTDRALIDVGRSFGCNPHQLYLKIILPSALPFILAGLRVGVARALVGIVVAEMFGANAGLGYLIFVKGQGFDTAGIFVGVVTLALAGVVFVELVKALARWVHPWRAHEVGR